MPTLLPRFTIEQPRTLVEASEMLLAFADEVRDAVHERFGVLLEREPVVLGE